MHKLRRAFISSACLLALVAAVAAQQPLAGPPPPAATPTGARRAAPQAAAVPTTALQRVRPAERPPAKKLYWMQTHAVLMSVGWVGLLPLGVLMAQSRWSSSMRTHVGHYDVWFWLHLVINVSAAALIIAAFGIACSDTSRMDIKLHDGSVAYTHKVLGIITLALLMLQVLLGILKPHHGGRFRGVWNHIHHNLGRLTLLTAWVVIWLGVATWKGEDDDFKTAQWVAPLAVFQGLLLLAYLFGMSIRNKAIHEAEVDEKYTNTLANRAGVLPATTYPTAAAPAGPPGLSAGGGSGSSLNAPGSPVYATSIRRQVSAEAV